MRIEKLNYSETTYRDRLEIELKERKENTQQEPDLFQQGYDQAVLDMIESGVL